MQPLPYADSDQRQFFIQWLTVFAAFVRDVDYESARPLFHADVLAFGTHHNVISSLNQWVTDQWENVWPNTSDFEFDLAETQILVSDDASMATVIAPWASIGYHSDQRSFERPGRATMIFSYRAGKWICTHSHMSLNRGVPQQSLRNDT